MNNGIENFAKIDESVEVFLADHLTKNQQDLINLLNNFSKDDSIKLYKTACYAFYKVDLPCRQMIVAHCMRELFNCFIDRDEALYKQEIQDAVKNMNFVKLAKTSDEVISDISGELSKKIKQLHNEEGKIKSFLSDLRPKLTQREINDIVEPALTAKKHLEKLRHYRTKIETIKEDFFLQYFSIIENFILSFKSSYYENKGELDDILDIANKTTD